MLNQASRISSSIIDEPFIDKSEVVLSQVFPAPVKSSTNRNSGDIVATLLHPTSNPANGHLGIREFQEIENHVVPRGLPLRHESTVAARSQGGLKSKIHSTRGKFSQAVEHDTAGRNRDSSRLEWAQSSRYKVGVYKFRTTRLAGQEFLSKRRLTRSIGTGNNKDPLPFSHSR